MAINDWPLKGLKADFTRVTDEAWNRYVKLCSIDFDNKVIFLNTGTAAEHYLFQARDCFVLGLHEISAFLCGKALEEALAWKCYREMKTRYGKEEAEKKIAGKSFSDLIKWGRREGLLPKRDDADACNREEAKVVDAVKWVRDLNAHASIIMMPKVQKMLESGGYEAEALTQVMPKEVQYPDWFVELANERGFTPDPKKPVVGWLTMEETAFNILKATVEIIARIFPVKPNAEDCGEA